MARKKQLGQIKTSAAEFGTKEYDNVFYAKFLVYSRTLSNRDCKEQVIDHMKSTNRYTETCNSLSSNVCNPCGIYIKMQNDGIQLPEAQQKSISEFIESLDDVLKEKAIKREQTLTKRSEQESKKINDVMSNVEVYIDDQMDLIRKNKKPIIDITEIFKTCKIHQSYFSSLVSKISDRVEHTVEELKLAKSKKDDQLVEAYSYLTPKQLSLYIDFLKQLQTNVVFNKPKQQRAPRKTKPKNSDQLVKRLQIKTVCDELKLSSCSPTEIIGSNLVFVYNTKTRSMVRYVSDKGFSVKGSTLLNVDLSNSFKKTIRKPEKIFASLNRSNMQFMQRLWASIKTKESTVKPRINKHCILLSCLNNNDGT